VKSCSSPEACLGHLTFSLGKQAWQTFSDGGLRDKVSKSSPLLLNSMNLKKADKTSTAHKTISSKKFFTEI